MNKKDEVQVARNAVPSLAVAQLTSVTSPPFSLPFLWHVYSFACDRVLETLPPDLRKTVETLLVLSHCIHKAEAGTLTGFDAQMLTEAVQGASHQWGA